MTGKQQTSRVHGLPLTLTFGTVNPGEVQVEQCSYELRSQTNVLKAEGDLAISFDVGSWTCILPEDMEVTDIIWLELKDTAGQVWATAPFRPLYGSRDFRKSS
jgi:hypothetical protein